MKTSMIISFLFVPITNLAMLKSDLNEAPSLSSEKKVEQSQQQEPERIYRATGKPIPLAVINRLKPELHKAAINYNKRLETINKK